MARKNISGQQFADRVTAGASASKFSEGIDRTVGSPPAKAAAEKDRMVANWNAASDRMVAALQNVSEADWKQKTKAKAQNYVVGLQANKQKIVAGGQKLMSHIQSGYSQLDSMPKGDSIGRATFWINHMKAMKQQS